ncbi:hypothetical protein VSP9026_03814 [Vibrio spartinae]|uniref:Uncharacterized protein n=1 Tax=Vibrio spartinae TaxID=1918945 RepID=A0A1N6M9L6_9VIBR|nr:hypothetical protein [Vibrio spartinae]SIO96056.1 hypothetical protein VSP9026_03814 [Vibrio spartinae]
MRTKPLHLNFYIPQPLAPNFDAQLRYSISEALVLCAPVHLSEMKDEPENLFLFNGVTCCPEPAFTGVLPNQENHSSLNDFLGWVVDLNWVKHFKSQFDRCTQDEI